MKKISTFIIIILLTTIAFFFRIIVSTDTSDTIPQQRDYNYSSPFSLSNYLKNNPVSEDSVIQKFPYKLYLDSANFHNIQTIKNDLTYLDTIFKIDSRANRKTFSRLLTQELADRYNEYFTTYRPDSLLVLIQWAEKFQRYAEAEPEDEILYRSIYHYWMDTISNSLEKFTIEKPSRKYDFKFRYIRTRCVEQRMSSGTKVTSSEKGINNLIYGNWGHLINATWNQTSILTKIVFSLFLLITIYGYFCILKKHVIK